MRDTYQDPDDLSSEDDYHKNFYTDYPHCRPFCAKRGKRAVLHYPGYKGGEDVTRWKCVLGGQEYFVNRSDSALFEPLDGSYPPDLVDVWL